LVELVGFNGHIPYSIIIWQLQNEDMSKTVCYTEQDEKVALNRFFTPGDYYNQFDKAQSFRSMENKVLEYQKYSRGA
jgi:hypothetical protein